jgi:hypothetical protein
MARRNRNGDFEFFGLGRVDADGYVRIFRKRSRLEVWVRGFIIAASLVITVAGVSKLIG